MLGEVSYHWAYKNLHLCDKCGRKYDDSSNCGMVDMLSRSRVRNRTHGMRDTQREGVRSMAQKKKKKGKAKK